MTALRQFLDRRWAVMVSIVLHGAALGLLLFTVTPAMISLPAAVEAPIIMEVVILAQPVRQPIAAPPPPPQTAEEPPPLIESIVSEEIAPPPPLPEVRPPEPQPKPQPKPKLTQPRPQPQADPSPLPPAETVQESALPAPSTPQQAAVVPVAPISPPADYVSLIRAQLERNKVYPRSAQQRRQQGRAMVRIAIDRAGHVIQYRLESSSGHELLDREVVAMIQRASPLPPVPPSFNGESLELVVPVEFFLR